MKSEKLKLLLHTCCGVCGAWVPELLSKDFVVDLYFFNPNIHPKDEYARRLEAAQRASHALNLKLIEGEYNPKPWLEAVRGFESEPEGGKRCAICFDFRLRQTALFAKREGHEYFASTLTIGRNKPAFIIDEIGQEWAKEFGIKFFSGDWKKKGGQVESDKRAHKMGLFRQNYCGCVYSMR